PRADLSREPAPQIVSYRTPNRPFRVISREVGSGLPWQQGNPDTSAAAAPGWSPPALRHSAEIRRNLATSQQIVAPGHSVGALTVLGAMQPPGRAADDGVRHSRAEITSAGIWRAHCE